MDVIEPPAIMLPYDGPLVRVVRPLKQVGIICRALGLQDRGRIYGCALYGLGGCLEIIADVPERKAIERHEDAHCNGWRHK